MVCVLDNSGSMDANATLQTPDGRRENYGLTVLDIVKHATKTIVHSLGEHDRCGIVV